MQLFSEYQTQAVKTAKLYSSLQANLVHVALGLATESGEFTTEVKRLAIYEAQYTDDMHNHMIEELGDLMWYIALAAKHLDIPLEEIATRNIEKLAKRFPEKYTNAAAEQRADKGGLNARAS